MKVVGYLRSSSDDPQVRKDSLAAQESELKIRTNQFGMQLTEMLREMEKREMARRSVLGKFLAKVKRGEIQGIICTSPDRLARTTWEGKVIRKMIQDKGIKVFTFK
jgi:DNA invertase Pin-like site-specific DNA recombinase